MEVEAIASRLEAIAITMEVELFKEFVVDGERHPSHRSKRGQSALSCFKNPTPQIRGRLPHVKDAAKALRNNVSNLLTLSKTHLEP